MKQYQISTELHNFCKTFADDLSKPQMGRFKEIMHGIVCGQKANLSEVARVNRSNAMTGMAIRRQVQQYSNMLSNFPLEIMAVRKMIGQKPNIKNDTPLYLDLVDLSKKYFNGKKNGMEAIGNTWNGSEGIPGKGYEMVDVSAGVKNTKMSLYRHLYSTKNIDYGSQVKEIRKLLEIMVSAWGEILGTIFVDMGGDNNLLINTFLEFEANFAIRMNVNRGVKDRLIFDEEGEKKKMMEIWGEPQEVIGWSDAKKKKQKIVQLQWRKIFLPYHKKMIPLFLIKSHREGDPDPCVFLTSRKIKNSADAEKVYRQYFERGGKEEAIFKCHKEKLGMEKVRLRSFKKVKQLMLIYVLVDQFLAKLEDEALEGGSLIYTLLKDYLQRTQRKITKWSIVDWYEDLWKEMERQTFVFRKRFRWRCSPNQLSLFFNPAQKW